MSNRIFVAELMGGVSRGISVSLSVGLLPRHTQVNLVCSCVTSVVLPC